MRLSYTHTTHDSSTFRHNNGAHEFIGTATKTAFDLHALGMNFTTLLGDAMNMNASQLRSLSSPTAPGGSNS